MDKVKKEMLNVIKVGETSFEIYKFGLSLETKITSIDIDILNDYISIKFDGGDINIYEDTKVEKFISGRKVCSCDYCYTITNSHGDILGSIVKY